MPIQKAPLKNALDIRLAESVVFLRAGDATGRQRNMQIDAPPGMLRGLLTLTLNKPTRISSIEIELVGKTNTAWPEGIGARRIEVSEEHEIYSQSYVLFRAGSETPYRNNRRTHSVGPGIVLDHDEDERSDHSSDEHGASVYRHVSEEQRGRALHPPPAGFDRTTRRHQSVDQTNFQRDYVSHRENGLPLVIPPYSPPYSAEGTPSYSLTPITLSPTTSIVRRMHTVEEAPIESALDIDVLTTGARSELERDHSSFTSLPLRRNGHAGASSVSSLRLDTNTTQSARPSLEEERPEFILGSSSSPFQAHLQSRSADFQRREASRSSDLREMEDGRGRKHKRFSLANVSSALLDVVMDRVRSRSRSSLMDHHGDVTPPRGRARERPLDVISDGSEESTPNRERSALGVVGGVLGLDSDEGKEYGDGWKEFRKGALKCEYGSVTWKLKATAHRPGTFTAKLSAAQEIAVVACPSEDDTEDTESIIVERQWDTQMQYLITISGRSFPIGGIMPVSITFMPWTKMKIYRVSVLLEERIDYWTDFKRIARTDPITRISLMSLKYPQKDAPPILPLDPDDPHAFERSPFVDLLEPSDDPGEYASNMMGPGPWTVKKDIQLPDSCSQLHFTNRNKRSNIFVSHMLKIIFRVERGDDQAIDAHTGKRKMFDIVVQTPIHILSCLCNHDYLSLPPYSRATEPLSPHHASCSYTSPAENNGGPMTVAECSTQSTFMLGVRRQIERAPSAHSDHPPVPIHTLLTPALSRTDSIFERGTQFGRLVAGQESELGEAPPAYSEVA
ncbi:uncharacterized protein LAESUDRAFT_780573 [Laetiporus sulphureus 93-53]|uniref:Arrestin C-terminal-like domain-containing protein n=1 Tax=Laetiporus sulphureus 93-53 TaxID=1314785 RepID=A0A165DPP1_9APHY|nr:uncharacterized protein LAESUDRAFT_780573 [Laetiporus sulphureus 93-53]KZT05351.1 hypothetical protein LAESUDRAFT_780573 [Laetiporus sulphureus 93-53]